MEEIRIDYPGLSKQILNEQQAQIQESFKSWILQEGISEQATIALADIIGDLLDVVEKRGVIIGLEIGKSAIQF